MTLALSSALPNNASSQDLVLPLADPRPFDHAWLVGEAERRATEPYRERSQELPGRVAETDYDQYRDIRYRIEARVWGGTNTPFTLDLFHPGWFFTQPVGIALVEDGVAREIRFSPALFDYGPSVQAPERGDGLAFSGFRVRTRINTPDYWDEFLVFQGASYFRAIARGQLYGLSARGVAINTAEPQGEEFPAFTHFWIERPAWDAAVLVVHALLDSPSLTGAYRFGIRPGTETVIDVEATIFPRQGIAKIGLAPLTSMFAFDATNRAGFDDFRPAVHDSDGLQMLTGAGEWLWRPLANPRNLQISAFLDRNPRGFGLMQRSRRFEDFQDPEARYERRPSLWIEPLGDWGKGSVELVEIPTEIEYNDNIVAYWRPSGPVPAGVARSLSYRMRWTDTVRPDGLLATRASRAGLTFDRKRRLFAIDFGSRDGTTPAGLALEVSASAGKIVNPTLHSALPNGSVRVSFELDVEAIELSELRARLLVGGKPASETWLYRWTAR